MFMEMLGPGSSRCAASLPSSIMLCCPLLRSQPVPHNGVRTFCITSACKPRAYRQLGSPGLVMLLHEHMQNPHVLYNTCQGHTGNHCLHRML